MKKGLYRLAALPRAGGSIPEIQTIGWMPDHIYFHRSHLLQPLFLCFSLSNEPGVRSLILDGRKQSYPSGQPYVSLIPPNTVITTIHALRHDELFFIYRPEALSFWQKYLPETPEPFAVTLHFKSILDDIFENMNELHTPGRADILDLLVLQLILEIRLQRQTQLESRNEQEIRRIASQLSTRFQEPLSIPELLRGTGLSQRTFYGLWNQFYDESPNEMLQEKRLFAAEQLLTTTDLRIQEIAAACGFSSAVYFYQRFHRKHGCSPAEYRREKLKRIAERSAN